MFFYPDTLVGIQQAMAKKTKGRAKLARPLYITFYAMSLFIFRRKLSSDLLCREPF